MENLNIGLSDKELKAIEQKPFYKRKVFGLPMLLIFCLVGVFAAVAINSILLNVHVLTPFSSEGDTISVDAWPNQNYIYYYNVTNAAPVEEYLQINVTTLSNPDSVLYTVIGGINRTIVPANIIYSGNVTLHINADSPDGIIQLRIDKNQVA